MPAVLQRTVPVLRMFDVAKAREFYIDYLGDGTPGMHVIVQMTGVDDLQSELAAKRYRYMNPSIQDQEWGTRELCVVDPSGNKVIFSERVAS